MIVGNHSPLREVTILSDLELQLVRAFMQGAIYSWIRNSDRKPFTVRDLVGGSNADWSGTSLQVLYDKHFGRCKTDAEAYDAAAQDLGWIVKSLLHQDKHSFALDQTGYANSYEWLGSGA
jgi:hypothetical protein